MASEQYAVHNSIGAPIDQTRLAEQALVCAPPRTAKFTLQEWKLSNDQRLRNAEDQQHLADRILGECEKVRDETKERSELLKETTDRRIEERIGDIEFNKQELLVQRKQICLELEALGMYKTRVFDCLASLQTNSLNIVRKCLMLRDGRIGIDLVVDPVEQALQTEITTVLGGQSLLRRALEQLQEQMRRLRATRYMLDRDLQYKQSAIDLDKGSLALKPTDLCLSIYEGYADLDPANISAAEYDAYSAKNIQLAAREVTSARPIRVYIDTLLKQVIDDLWKAYDRCNREFNERITATKIAKARLEDLHRETTEKIMQMQTNILELKKALAHKEGHIGLAHTRLGRRAQRVEGELVKDPPGQTLFYECEMLRRSTQELQQMLHEANASLRYLCQTQIQLEEDINVKMNTLKIDEVDCMTLRATMDYHSY
ncbi:tektin-1 [Plutella xylostella]|uniref:tektin-1 n=1 Tax=Plutella xylostella TaxID=51655 RepID=UPI002032CBBD|nr:tektin-1 [Plutella xylostella]